MAIVKCPNCGKMVSDTNKRCTACDGDLVKIKFACADCGSANIRSNTAANEGNAYTFPLWHFLGLFGLFLACFSKGDKERELRENGYHYICNDCNSHFRIRHDLKA